jgi:hypothetical protein
MSVYEDLLLEDFRQCFEQMRHYDEVFRKVLEWGYGGTVAVVAASAALIEHYGLASVVVTATTLLFLASGLGGFLLVISLARNRVYFAVVSRYVNELRSTYLSHFAEIGNRAGIYVDPASPKPYNPLSTHSIQLYLLACCTSLLWAGATAGADASRALARGKIPGVSWWWVCLAFIISVTVQVGWSLRYWLRQQKGLSGLVSKQREA